MIFENNPCSTEKLYDYKTATELGLTCYITVEIPGEQVTDDGLRVNIGDGETYDKYHNAPLEPDTEYLLAIGLVADFEVTENPELFIKKKNT